MEVKKMFDVKRNFRFVYIVTQSDRTNARIMPNHLWNGFQFI